MIVEDSYLVPPNVADYMSVRSLRLRGTDEEMGRELAELARRDYGTALTRYADPAYAAARVAYLDRNHPTLAARARGVAEVFGLAPGDTVFDTSILAYDGPARPACSAVFVPAALTTTGHPLIGRNMDWYLLRMSRLAGLPAGPDEHLSCSRTVLLSTTSESGRTALQLGSHDMLSPGYDGMNEAGLMIALLVDHQGAGNPGASPAGGFAHGLSSMQLVGYVLATANTVAEAKQALLTQHFFVPTPEGQHWLIADATGAATVFEIDGKTRQYHFVDACDNAPLVMTNHALHTYPTLESFPQVDPGKEHDSFVRYRMLTDAVAAHSGPWSPDDVNALLDVVLCAFVDNTAAGVAGGMPERTLWNYLADPVARSYRFRFHQHDEGPEPGTNHMRVRRTDPIEVSMDSVLA
ncbi:C45 family autoproteolytic acyltransferase/hydrolase [Nocardia sp. NPDC127579]|uniref:C45 family autoproteolytic acyltransferase/hydolase n=1 Tax=Nocardia sp. NPDC127579 TaxID=3345402 RepID=UPI003645D0C6